MGAVVKFTRSMAREVALMVRINFVCPGVIDNDVARARVPMLSLRRQTLILPSGLGPLMRWQMPYYIWFHLKLDLSLAQHSRSMVERRPAHDIIETNDRR